MKILVTGGAGYIGSHTVRKLKEAGHNIVIFDNLSSGHREAVEGYDLVVGDLANKEDLKKVFAENKFEAVIHFAGSIEAGESMINPQKFFQNNVANGLNLLEVMLKRGVKKMVFSSSAAVYGEPKNMPVLETTPTAPTNVYGLTKLMFEQILDSYDSAYGIKHVALRYFNATGADPGGEIGPDHKNKTHLLTLTLLTALGQRDAIKIFGADYPTFDGTCIRDYIHVSDLADAHVLALDFLHKEGKSDKFNLGSEKGTSVREVIETAKKVTGLDFPVLEEKRRPGDPAKIYASSKKAQKILGWKPQFTNIEDIIKTAWNWHKNNPDGYKQQPN